jgi:hypothetical protein
MIENEMGYRGSKSKLGLSSGFVKEQRVDGGYCINPCLPYGLRTLVQGKEQGKGPMQLRCILMGCENSYQIKIPSKQLNRKIFFFKILLYLQLA